jgi:cytidine deaminase
MVERRISTKIQFYTLQELPEAEKKLIEAAILMSANAYAPYSNFKVGAACLLDNGSVVGGNNQENAAYPAGICAERNAVFQANALYPDSPVVSIAIAAQNSQGYLADPIAPCGICRQVLLESEQRFKTAIRILLYGTNEIAIFESASNLLPLSFGVQSL